VSKKQVKAILNLQSSDGWELIKKVMEDEILQAAMQIGENPNMELNEINFRRGAIWAANRMLELPDRLKIKLENEVALLQRDDIKSDKDI
tara:strand:- start:1827 stop:2096 length:270 start_codon:yes stop_codon:yes gene_type:complete